MKRSLVFSLIPFSTLFISSVQADYLVEFGPTFESSERKDQSEISIDSIAFPFLSASGSSSIEEENKALGAFFTVYFDRISTSGLPLAEAAFLSQTGKFSVLLESGSKDIDADFEIRDSTNTVIGSDSLSISQDVTTIDLDAEYVTPGVPVIIGFGTRYDIYSEEDDDVIDIEADILTLKAKLGIYITRNGALTFRYDDVDIDSDDGDDSSGSAKTLAYRHLIPISGEHHIAISASAGRTEDDDGDEIKVNQIGLTYYPTYNVSVGVDWSKVDDENGDTDGFGFFSEVFFSEHVSVKLDVHRTDGSESETEKPSPTITATQKNKLERNQANFQLKVRF